VNAARSTDGDRHLLRSCSFRPLVNVVVTVWFVSLHGFKGAGLDSPAPARRAHDKTEPVHRALNNDTIEYHTSEYHTSEYDYQKYYSEYTITNTGQWWYGEHEIDAVGLTTGETLIVGECKFQQSPLGYDALSNLEDHTDELQWSPQSGSDRVVEYALFSRSGFKQSVTEAASQRDDLRLFSLTDVVTALTET
jgi:hypothetical protein